MKKQRLLLYILLLPAALTLLSRCGSQPQSGSELAAIHCGSCHLFPEPGLLPRKTWEQRVLPVMSAYLGNPDARTQLLQTLHPSEMARIEQAGIFPPQPVLTDTAWEAIRRYYREQAPDSLPLTADAAGLRPLGNRFSLQEIRLPMPPSVTMVKHFPGAQRLFFGIQSGFVASLGADFAIEDTFRVRSTPADVHLEGDQLQVLTMGKMNPGDMYSGELTALSLSKDQRGRATLLAGINRPVEMQYAELDGEEGPELLVCEFGHHLGSLFWCKLDAAGRPRGKKLLSTAAGCRMTKPFDLNGDGKTDILALFTQGNERIVAFLNRGGGRFEEQELLRFPPVHGTSWFELADFNGDGLQDLLVANGDNGDYSAVLKPYHGIRVFINDGKKGFREKAFQPLNGAAKALAHDYDDDGDLDIAAISYFADTKNSPQEGFVFYENKGGLRFEALSMPEAALGRWMVMEGGDFDADGDQDLILGSCLTAMRGFDEEAAALQAREKVSLLVLLNQTKP